MPLYDLKCPDCQMVSEHIMGVQDQWLIVKCPHCGHGLRRGDHKHYEGMRIQIQGDTVAGGCNYNYYDEELGCQIKNKQHRADEMKKQGLQDYSPNPEYKKFRDEQRYIKKHSKPGDADAAAALKQQQKAAVTKRREDAVDRAFDNAPMPALPEI
jgi:putative FmdB family regulatory protein